MTKKALKHKLLFNTKEVQIAVREMKQNLSKIPRGMKLRFEGDLALLFDFQNGETKRGASLIFAKPSHLLLDSISALKAGNVSRLTLNFPKNRSRKQAAWTVRP